MAKVQIVDTIEVKDSTERTVTIQLNEAQIHDALFTWMRLNNVKLPSQELSDYNIQVHCESYTSGKRYALIVWKDPTSK